MGSMLLKLLLGCLMPLLSGLMVALFQIKSQVFPLLALGFLLISLSIVGESVGGVMLIGSVLMVWFRLVEAPVRSLGLYRLFKGLSGPAIFWCCAFGS